MHCTNPLDAMPGTRWLYGLGLVAVATAWVTRHEPRIAGPGDFVPEKPWGKVWEKPLDMGFQP